MAIERDRRDPDASWNKNRPQRNKKNTKKWCKGKVGVEHITEVIVPENAGSIFTRDRPPCHTWETTYRGPVWWCLHYNVCITCGKHVSRAKVCPANVDNIPNW